jgi:hypothetical protein
MGQLGWSNYWVKKNVKTLTSFRTFFSYVAYNVWDSRTQQFWRSKSALSPDSSEPRERNMVSLWYTCPVAYWLPTNYTTWDSNLTLWFWSLTSKPEGASSHRAHSNNPWIFLLTLALSPTCCHCHPHLCALMPSCTGRELCALWGPGRYDWYVEIDKKKCLIQTYYYKCPTIYYNMSNYTFENVESIF